MIDKVIEDLDVEIAKNRVVLDGIDEGVSTARIEARLEIAEDNVRESETEHLSADSLVNPEGGIYEGPDGGGV